MIQGFLTGYNCRQINCTPTIAPLRDPFSADGYTAYLKDWNDAGLFMRNVVKKSDRVFTWQSMCSVALTDAYLVDQFYFPARVSKYQDIRTTMAQPPDSSNIMALYDYVLCANNQYQFKTHDRIASFNSLDLWKRKDFGSPSTPVAERIHISDPTVIDIHWIPEWNNLGYILEAKKDGESDFKEIYRTGPGYFVQRVNALIPGQKVEFRVRSFNLSGISEPSNILTYN